MDVLELPRPVINFLRTMSKEMNRYSLCWDIYGGTESVTLTLTWKINYDQAENALLENSKEKHKQHIIKLMNSELMSNEDDRASYINTQSKSTLKSEKPNTKLFKKKNKFNKQHSKLDNMFTNKPSHISNTQNDKQNIRLSNSCFFNSHEKRTSKSNLHDNNKQEYQQNSPCSDDFYYNPNMNRVKKELKFEENELEKLSYNEENVEEIEDDMLSTDEESHEDFLNQFRTDLSLQTEKESKLNPRVDDFYANHSNTGLSKHKKLNIGKELVPHLVFNQTNRKKKSLNLKKSRGKSLESHLNEKQISNQNVQCNCKFEKEKCPNKTLETATADNNCSLKVKSNFANSSFNESNKSMLQDSQPLINYSYSAIDDFKSDLNNLNHRKTHQLFDQREKNEGLYINQIEFDSIPIRILHECKQNCNASQQKRYNHLEYSSEDNPWVRREDSSSDKSRNESELRKSLNVCYNEKSKTSEKNTLNSQLNQESNQSKLLDKCDHYFSVENAAYASIEKSNLNLKVPSTNIKSLTNSTNMYSSLNSNKSFVNTNTNNTNHSKVTFDPNLEYI